MAILPLKCPQRRRGTGKALRVTGRGANVLLFLQAKRVRGGLRKMMAVMKGGSIGALLHMKGQVRG